MSGQAYVQEACLGRVRTKKGKKTILYLIKWQDYDKLADITCEPTKVAWMVFPLWESDGARASVPGACAFSEAGDFLRGLWWVQPMGKAGPPYPWGPASFQLTQPVPKTKREQNSQVHLGWECLVKNLGANPPKSLKITHPTILIRLLVPKKFCLDQLLHWLNFQRTSCAL